MTAYTTDVRQVKMTVRPLSKKGKYSSKYEVTIAHVPLEPTILMLVYPEQDLAPPVVQTPPTLVHYVLIKEVAQTVGPRDYGNAA